jgi:hypothetical protein
MGLTIGSNRVPMISVGEGMGKRRYVAIVNEIAINMNDVKVMISFLLAVSFLISLSMLFYPFTRSRFF